LKNEISNPNIPLVDPENVHMSKAIYKVTSLHLEIPEWWYGSNTFGYLSFSGFILNANECYL